MVPEPAFFYLDFCHVIFQPANNDAGVSLVVPRRTSIDIVQTYRFVAAVLVSLWLLRVGDNEPMYLFAMVPYPLTPHHKLMIDHLRFVESGDRGMVKFIPWVNDDAYGAVCPILQDFVGSEHDRIHGWEVGASVEGKQAYGIVQSADGFCDIRSFQRIVITVPEWSMGKLLHQMRSVECMRLVFRAIDDEFPSLFDEIEHEAIHPCTFAMTGDACNYGPESRCHCVKFVHTGPSRGVTPWQARLMKYCDFFCQIEHRYDA